MVVMVEQLACLHVTQKVGVRFYLANKAAPRAAELNPQSGRPGLPATATQQQTASCRLGGLT